MPVSSATPAEQPKAAAEIGRLGFKYAEVAQYDLSQVSPDRRVQVRDLKNYAPRESVERYAIQMGHTAFPPIIMTSDGWIVDGNTRVGACLLRKEKFFPALVLDVAWESASEKTRDMLVALAATLNAQNGIPLTGKETRDVVRRFVRLGWLNEQIARAIGVKAGTVTMVRKEIEAEAKLDKVGLDSGSLKGASLRALGAKDVVTLNDVPFKTLAELAADAGLNASEIVAVAKDARETGSDAGALSMLASLREEMGDRIQEHTLTGSARPPLSRQLRQHLGFVTKFSDGREQELIETDPRVGPQHAETLEKAIAVLTTVLEMQRPS